ncbi:MAG: hypothetical protein ACRDN8_18865 [Thermoleophilaceae bacterium]
MPVVAVAARDETGVGESLSKQKLVEVGGQSAPKPKTAEEFVAGMDVLRWTPRLADVTEAAAFSPPWIRRPDLSQGRVR